jgi:uncharacterized protein (DUF2164 family)
MTLELTAEDRKQAQSSLVRFCDQELDIELSQIQAARLLDFIVKELGPSFHNAALTDAQTFVRDRLAEMESSLTEPTFTYWPKGTAVRRK